MKAMEMSSGRAATTKRDDGFTTRTVMAMATEMAEARAGYEQGCVQFEALATAHGVKVDWGNTEA
jgi:hypothetical protein